MSAFIRRGRIPASCRLPRISVSCCVTARFASLTGPMIPRVQDAYCLRCMPQVHGAARGAMQHVREVIEIETGSATDNP